MKPTTAVQTLLHPVIGYRDQRPGIILRYKPHMDLAATYSTGLKLDPKIGTPAAEPEARRAEALRDGSRWKKQNEQGLAGFCTDCALQDLGWSADIAANILD